MRRGREPLQKVNCLAGVLVLRSVKVKVDDRQVRLGEVLAGATDSFKIALHVAQPSTASTKIQQAEHLTAGSALRGSFRTLRQGPVRRELVVDEQGEADRLDESFAQEIGMDVTHRGRPACGS